MRALHRVRCRSLLAVGLSICTVAGSLGEEPPVRFARLGSEHGIRRYAEHRWGVVGVDVVNPAATSREVLAIVMLGGDVETQFARSIWLPPRSVRRSWLPIKVPDLPTGVGLIACDSLLVEPGGGTDVAVRTQGEQMLHRTLLRVNRSPMLTGVILPDGEDPRQGEVDYPYEAVVALRTWDGMNRRLAMIGDRYLPAMPEALDALDHLVLDNNRFADDVAGIEAIRGWLYDGGQLWIMLDRVTTDAAMCLLGGELTCEEVDRVELNTVELLPVSPRPAVSYAAAAEFEQPVTLVRVAVSGAVVVHTVEGWPASFWLRVGRGKVVFTTVGAEAWIERHRGARPIWDVEFMTDFQPTPQLEELPLMERRNRIEPEPAAAESYLAEQIGYRVPQRRPVIALLAAYCGVLLFAAIAFSRLHRLEWLSWLVPAAALSAALLLVGLGQRARSGVPATVGELQLIEVGENGQRAMATGTLGLYPSVAQAAASATSRGGVFDPQLAAQKGTIRRLIWRDLDRWEFAPTRMPSGLHLASFRRSIELTKPVQAEAAFEGDGLCIRTMGFSADLEDAILLVPGQPRMAVRRESDGLRSSGEEMLASGQYIVSRWLTEEQRRRQAAYQMLLDEMHVSRQWLDGLALLGWAEPLDLEFQFAGVQKRVGGSLWFVPLRIQRPAAGASIVIPSPLLTYRTAVGPWGGGPSPLYDRYSGEWIETNDDSRVWLRFELPAELSGLKVERARLELRVTAPDRSVAIVRSAPDGGSEVAAECRSPLGRYTWDLADPERLGDGQDGLQLGLVVTELEPRNESRKPSRWKIDLLQLEVSGRMP